MYRGGTVIHLLGSTDRLSDTTCVDGRRHAISLDAADCSVWGHTDGSYEHL